VTSLIKLYGECHYLRESLVIILEKLLVRAKGASNAAGLMKIIVKEMFTDSDKKRRKFTHPDQVSLFLTLQHVFRSHQEYRIKADAAQAQLLSKDMLEDSQSLEEITAQLGKATYLFPRQHSCMDNLLREAFRHEDPKLRLKRCKTLTKTLLENHLFKVEEFKDLKGTVRPKFLHIGLKFWLSIA